MWTSSPEFTLLDNRWYANLYPGGDGQNSEGHISFYLYNRGPKPITATGSFTIVDSKGAQVLPPSRFENTFPALAATGWGFSKFLLRADVLDASKRCLENDTLRIKITIEIKTLKLAKALATLLDNASLRFLRVYCHVCRCLLQRREVGCQWHRNRCTPRHSQRALRVF